MARADNSGRVCDSLYQEVIMREDLIHYAVRQFLRTSGWRLIAGQFPDGSDSELPPLNIIDPYLACDNSPDHRRHSMNKYVPDLVALKGDKVLVIEMKPNYSLKDERKLETILNERKKDLLTALGELISKRSIDVDIRIDDIVFVPCLGFSISSSYEPKPSFCYFKVKDISQVYFKGNTIVPSI